MMRCHLILPSMTTALARLMCCLTLALAGPGLALAQEAPDTFMQRLSSEVLDTIRKDPALKAGDLQKSRPWSTTVWSSTSISNA